MMGNWVYQYDIAALVFLVIILWMLLKFKNFPLETNRIFKWLLVTAIFATIFDLLGTYVLVVHEEVPEILQYLAQILYLYPNLLCAVLYYAMTCAMTKPFRKPSKIRAIILYAIPIIDFPILFSSPFTHWIFKIENGVYIHGPLMPVRYSFAIFLMILVMIDTFRCHKLMSHAQKRMSYGYTLLCLSALVFQVFYPNILLLSFAISIASLLGYFALQNPADLTDKKSEAKRS